MNCKKCSAEIQGTSKFCKQCGTPVSVESPASTPTKICPQCGAENFATAKFCKRDGYSFDAKPQAAQATQSVPANSPPPVPPPPPSKEPQSSVNSTPPLQTIKSSSKVPIIIGIVVVLLLVAGAGGYFYWAKKNSGESTNAATEAETTSKPQAKITAPPPAIKSQEQPVVAAPSPVPSAYDSAQVERGLNQELSAAGLAAVVASVDDRLRTDLKGTVVSKVEKEKAVGIARGYSGVTGVDATAVKIVPPKVRSEVPVVTPFSTRQPQPVVVPPAALQKRDPAKMEGEIGRNLRVSGINGITAQVSDDFAVTLKGSVRSVAEKDRAFDIARQFGAVGRIKDKVFIVE
ncbi:MAG: BON domain-containing protein [Proteobacteria bacterium]|nr:BON domain-containing protein [Pseudomonadota bacterium]